MSSSYMKSLTTLMLSYQEQKMLFSLFFICRFKFQESMAVESNRDNAMKNIIFTSHVTETLNDAQTNTMSLQEKLNVDVNVWKNSTDQSGPSNLHSSLPGDARENKPPSKQKYPGTVSNAEINLMRLSAKTCRSANALLPREPFASSTPLWTSPPSSHGWQKKKLVNGFCVRNCDRLHLIPELGLPDRLLQRPGPFCTDADSHMARLKTSQLSQACPTCWSSQRHRWRTGISGSWFVLFCYRRPW